MFLKPSEDGEVPKAMDVLGEVRVLVKGGQPLPLKKYLVVVVLEGSSRTEQ